MKTTLLTRYREAIRRENELKERMRETLRELQTFASTKRQGNGDNRS